MAAARAFDNALDTAWRALSDRLGAYTTLPADIAPRAGRAIELRATLFPAGLGFLNLPFTEEWAESERLLTTITQGKLAKDLDAICGDLFLAQVKRTHAGYGEALGITKPVAPAAVAPSLTVPLRTVQSAIASYARRIVGEVEDDEPKTVAIAQAALRPYEEFRKPAKRAAPVEPEPIETPIPPVPASFEGEVFD